MQFGDAFFRKGGKTFQGINSSILGAKEVYHIIRTWSERKYACKYSRDFQERLSLAPLCQAVALAAGQEFVLAGPSDIK
jgi:hypothetical protein